MTQSDADKISDALDLLDDIHRELKADCGYIDKHRCDTRYRRAYVNLCREHAYEGKKALERIVAGEKTK